jgi:hypothetical protein
MIKNRIQKVNILQTRTLSTSCSSMATVQKKCNWRESSEFLKADGSSPADCQWRPDSRASEQTVRQTFCRAGRLAGQKRHQRATCEDDIELSLWWPCLLQIHVSSAHTLSPSPVSKEKGMNTCMYVLGTCPKHQNKTSQLKKQLNGIKRNISDVQIRA